MQGLSKILPVPTLVATLLRFNARAQCTRYVADTFVSLLCYGRMRRLALDQHALRSYGDLVDESPPAHYERPLFHVYQPGIPILLHNFDNTTTNDKEKHPD